MSEPLSLMMTRVAEEGNYASSDSADHEIDLRLTSSTLTQLGELWRDDYLWGTDEDSYEQYLCSLRLPSDSTCQALEEAELPTEYQRSQWLLEPSGKRRKLSCDDFTSLPTESSCSTVQSPSASLSQSSSTSPVKSHHATATTVDHISSLVRAFIADSKRQPPRTEKSITENALFSASQSPLRTGQVSGDLGTSDDPCLVKTGYEAETCGQAQQSTLSQERLPAPQIVDLVTKQGIAQALLIVPPVLELESSSDEKLPKNLSEDQLDLPESLDESLERIDRQTSHSAQDISNQLSNGYISKPTTVLSQDKAEGALSICEHRSRIPFVSHLAKVSNIAQRPHLKHFFDQLIIALVHPNDKAIAADVSHLHQVPPTIRPMILSLVKKFQTDDQFTKSVTLVLAGIPSIATPDDGPDLVVVSEREHDITPIETLKSWSREELESQFRRLERRKTPSAQ